MPRGIPNSGVRKSRTKKVEEQTSVIEFETDQEIDARLRERFDILSDLVHQAVSGDVRALIVSGPPGLGKSYTIEKTLEKNDPNAVNHQIVRGYVKATGLYKLLWQCKEKGKVLVFDDADTIFFDDTSLNMLKAVCDTTEKRKVSYLAEGYLIDEETATRLPKNFEFNGTIIFLTNYDFDAMIDKGHKLAPHLQALVSRAHYVDLAMKTSRDYLIRIKQVVSAGLLDNLGLDKSGQADVMEFIDTNHKKLRELSLRIALKVAAIRKSGSSRWKSTAKVTCCRN